MALFGKLFGARSVAEERAEAERLFATGEIGTARLAFERARDRCAEDPALAAELDQRVRACADVIARRHLAEADRLLADGAADLAAAELESAHEVAASDAVRDEVARRLDALERRDARERAVETDQTADERYETLGGHWELAQAQEYETYGEGFRAALLALADGRAADARTALEGMLGGDPGICYLWLEIGRARVLDGDRAGGESALRTFLQRLPADEGGDARLVAHVELAGLRHEAGDMDAALAEYEAALEAMPEDPRPYLAMAIFLRKQGMAEDALDVLDSALAVIGDGTPEWRVLHEIGLAHADLGHDAEAVTTLEGLVAHLVGRQHLDVPPEGTLRLARLHEQRGDKPRALDLYTMLAAGSDRSGHLRYHREAARLMTDLGLRDEARRMLQRAHELAADDAEARAEIERALAAM
jgi:tetratricopeptide (TPR) repeat protein